MKFMNVTAVDGILKMAKIVMGADSFGAESSEQDSFALMDAYVAHGGNTIDTARIYGKDGDLYKSEEVVGRWLAARGNRDSIVLVTKGAHPDRANVTKSRISEAVIDSELAFSLNELQVDRVDVYFLHRDNPAMPVGEIMDILHEHVKAGRVRALGASNWSCARMKEANDYAAKTGKTPFSISQIQWGVARTTSALWGDPTLLAMNETEYAGYLASGIPIMGFAAQGGGYFSKLLAGDPLREKVAARYDTPDNRRRFEIIKEISAKTGKSAAAICMAFLACNPVQSAAIVGCSSVAQLEDSMSACDFTLDAADCAALVK